MALDWTAWRELNPEVHETGARLTEVVAGYPDPAMELKFVFRPTGREESRHVSGVEDLAEMILPTIGGRSLMVNLEQWCRDAGNTVIADKMHEVVALMSLENGLFWNAWRSLGPRKDEKSAYLIQVLGSYPDEGLTLEFRFLPTNREISQTFTSVKELADGHKHSEGKASLAKLKEWLSSGEGDNEPMADLVDRAMKLQLEAEKALYEVAEGVEFPPDDKKWHSLCQQIQLKQIQPNAASDVKYKDGKGKTSRHETMSILLHYSTGVPGNNAKNHSVWGYFPDGSETFKVCALAWHRNLKGDPAPGQTYEKFQGGADIPGVWFFPMG